MLNSFFDNHNKVAVAFSGGVDSAFLLYEAVKYAGDCTAYLARSAFNPSFEINDAKHFAASVGAKLRILDIDVLASSDICRNESERCYLCKRLILSRIISAAKADGYAILLDGANADDDPAGRPGMRAAEELSVLSPMRELGIGKAEIRRASREAGLFTWDKPSYSCLATRIAQGEAITGDKLARIERGETALMALGFRGFRLRMRGGEARLEILPEQLPLALEKREEILSALSGDFSEILLNMKGMRKTL
jgi:uncharacterized protein